MTRIKGPRGTAFLGEWLALAAVARLIAGTPRDTSKPAVYFVAGIGLAVGTPLSVPWFVLWLSNRASPNRVLSLLEVGFYGVLLLYEVLLLGSFPKLMVESEGFAMPLMWAIGAPIAVLAYLLSRDDRGRVTPKDTDAR
jgi:hypothetical protein